MCTCMYAPIVGCILHIALRTLIMSVIYISPWQAVLYAVLYGVLDPVTLLSCIAASVYTCNVV